MKKIKLINIKEKFFFYHKQKKFQLSVVDCVPYFDWYSLLAFLLVSIVSAGLLSWFTYSDISEKIDQAPADIVIEKEYVNFDEINSLVNKFEIRENRLNTLR